MRTNAAANRVGSAVEHARLFGTTERAIAILQASAAV